MKSSSVFIFALIVCSSQIGCGWVPGWSSSSEEAATEVAEVNLPDPLEKPIDQLTPEEHRHIKSSIASKISGDIPRNVIKSVSEPLAQDDMMNKIGEAINGIVSGTVRLEADIDAASVELNDVIQSGGFIGPISNATEFEQSLDPKLIKKAVVKTGELGLIDYAEIQMNLFDLECLNEEQWEMLQAIWVECIDDWNNFPVEYIRSRFIRHLDMAADALEMRKREKRAVLTPRQLSNVAMAQMYASRIFDGHIRPSVERYYKSILDKQITTARLQSQATVTE